MSRETLLFSALANDSSYEIDRLLIYTQLKQKDLVAIIAQYLPPAITLGEITPEVIDGYQSARIRAGDVETFHMEMGLIIAVLKSANLWDGPLNDMYRGYVAPGAFSDIPPREGYVPPPPEVLEYARLQSVNTERKRARAFLATAICNANFRLGYLHAQLTIGTGIAFDDTRYIRLSDINRDALTVRVRGYHVVPERTVTVCGNDAILALDELAKRSRGFGASDEDFLFPFKKANYKWTPQRPMTHQTLLNQYQLINKALGGKDWDRITPACLCHLYGTQPLNEIEPELPPAPEVPATHASPDAGKLYDMAKDVNAKIGDGMVSIKSLIARLRKAGVAPDVILGIIADEEEV